jgi:hypothetical protein
MSKNLEIIKKGKNILAIIIYDNYHSKKISFFTPENFSQQLAFMFRNKKDVVNAHFHGDVKREIYDTQEVLIIKKGKVKINLYDSSKKYLDSRILKKGDIILLAEGGHGLEMLEDVEMIEIKQGPYFKEKDKIKFKGVEN